MKTCEKTDRFVQFRQQLVQISINPSLEPRRRKLSLGNEGSSSPLPKFTLQPKLITTVKKSCELSHSGSRMFVRKPVFFKLPMNRSTDAIQANGLRLPNSPVQKPLLTIKTASTADPEVSAACQQLREPASKYSVQREHPNGSALAQHEAPDKLMKKSSLVSRKSLRTLLNQNLESPICLTNEQVRKLDSTESSTPTKPILRRRTKWRLTDAIALHQLLDQPEQPSSALKRVSFSKNMMVRVYSKDKCN